MRAGTLDEVGTAGVVIGLLFEAHLVAVIGGVVEGAPFTSTTAASTASCTAAATPSSTVAACTAAVLRPVRFPPVVPALLLDVGRWEIVAAVTVSTAVEALHPTGNTLCVDGNPTAHNRFYSR